MSFPHSSSTASLPEVVEGVGAPLTSGLAASSSYSAGPASPLLSPATHGHSSLLGRRVSRPTSAHTVRFALDVEGQPLPSSSASSAAAAASASAASASAAASALPPPPRPARPASARPRRPTTMQMEQERREGSYDRHAHHPDGNTPLQEEGEGEEDGAEEAESIEWRREWDLATAAAASSSVSGLRAEHFIAPEHEPELMEREEWTQEEEEEQQQEGVAAVSDSYLADAHPLAFAEEEEQRFAANLSADPPVASTYFTSGHVPPRATAVRPSSAHPSSSAVSTRGVGPAPAPRPVRPSTARPASATRSRPSSAAAAAPPSASSTTLPFSSLSAADQAALRPGFPQPPRPRSGFNAATRAWSVAAKIIRPPTSSTSTRMLHEMQPHLLTKKAKAAASRPASSSSVDKSQETRRYFVRGSGEEADEESTTWESALHSARASSAASSSPPHHSRSVSLDFSLAADGSILEQEEGVHLGHSSPAPFSSSSAKKAQYASAHRPAAARPLSARQPPFISEFTLRPMSSGSGRSVGKGVSSRPPSARPPSSSRSPTRASTSASPPRLPSYPPPTLGAPPSVIPSTSPLLHPDAGWWSGPPAERIHKIYQHEQLLTPEQEAVQLGVGGRGNGNAAAAAGTIASPHKRKVKIRDILTGEDKEVEVDEKAEEEKQQTGEEEKDESPAPSFPSSSSSRPSSAAPSVSAAPSAPVSASHPAPFPSSAPSAYQDSTPLPSSVLVVGQGGLFSFRLNEPPQRVEEEGRAKDRPVSPVRRAAQQRGGGTKGAVDVPAWQSYNDYSQSALSVQRARAVSAHGFQPLPPPVPPPPPPASAPPALSPSSSISSSPSSTTSRPSSASRSRGMVVSASFVHTPPAFLATSSSSSASVGTDEKQVAEQIGRREAETNRVAEDRTAGAAKDHAVPTSAPVPSSSGSSDRQPPPRAEEEKTSTAAPPSKSPFDIPKLTALPSPSPSPTHRSGASVSSSAPNRSHSRTPSSSSAPSFRSHVLGTFYHSAAFKQQMRDYAPEPTRPSPPPHPTLYSRPATARPATARPAARQQTERGVKSQSLRPQSARPGSGGTRNNCSVRANSRPLSARPSSSSSTSSSSSSSRPLSATAAPPLEMCIQPAALLPPTGKHVRRASSTSSSPEMETVQRGTAPPPPPEADEKKTAAANPTTPTDPAPPPPPVRSPALVVRSTHTSRLRYLASAQPAAAPPSSSSSLPVRAIPLVSFNSLPSTHLSIYHAFKHQPDEASLFRQMWTPSSVITQR